MSSEYRDYWVSKHWQTAGIRRQQLRRARSGSEYLYAADGWTSYRDGVDAHESMSAAVEAAEVARTKKLASLRKQIKKIEALDFTPEAPNEQ